MTRLQSETELGIVTLERICICFQTVLLLLALLAPHASRAAGPTIQCEDDNSADASISPAPTPAPSARSSLVGAEAPDFTLQDASGHAFHLRDLRGKVVVIDFWASSCPSSRAAMPYLQQMHDQYGSRGLIVLGLNLGEDAKVVAEFGTDSSYTFPLLVGAKPDVAAKYLVSLYPMTFVISRDGRIAFAGSPADSPGGLLNAVKSAVGKP
jgi:thiol-disulfide isomerase/thioredoxin